MSAVRFNKELDKVEDFVNILPPILSEGKFFHSRVKEESVNYALWEIGKEMFSDVEKVRII